MLFRLFRLQDRRRSAVDTDIESGCTCLAFEAKCSRRGLLESGQDASAIAGPTGVLHEEDGDELVLAVVARVRAVSPAVREGLAIGAEAEAIVGFGLTGLIAGRGLHGFFGEDACAVERAAVRHHAVEERQVIRRREQAACRHREALAAVERIEKLAHGQFFEAILRCVRFVGLCEAGLLLLVGPKGRVVHAQRLEEPLSEEGFILHATDHFDDAACGVDASVGVLGFATGLEQQCHLRVAADALGQRLQIERWGFHRRFEIKPAGVAEHFTHQDRMTWSHEFMLLWIGAEVHPLTFELRQILLYRIIDANFALIDQDHERHRCDWLRLRSDPEHRVRLHRLLRRHIFKPHRLDIQHLVRISHQHHRPRERLAIDIRLQNRREFLARQLGVQCCRGDQEKRGEVTADAVFHVEGESKMKGMADDSVRCGFAMWVAVVGLGIGGDLLRQAIGERVEEEFAASVINDGRFTLREARVSEPHLLSLRVREGGIVPAA